MTISLVTITHPVDTTATVPYIEARAPLVRIPLETWKVRAIAGMGFCVEIHAEPYDPVAAANAAAVALAARLAAASPASTVSVHVPEPVAPVVVEDVVVPEVETYVEPAVTEENSISEEELTALRQRITALATLADAKALMAEYEIVIENCPPKLREIKTQLLALIDA